MHPIREVLSAESSASGPEAVRSVVVVAIASVVVASVVAAALALFKSPSGGG